MRRTAPYGEVWGRSPFVVDHGQVTLHLVDVSRYQVERPNPLDLAQARSAGYHIANIALTGGRGYMSGQWAVDYADRARQLGMGLSTYHWLDGRTPGADQASYTIARLAALGGPDRIAHSVDVEETGVNGITPPTWAHVRDYVNAVQDFLQHPIVIYSGDWWWEPKGWGGVSLTPYLMAQPNDGKTDTYPGDGSDRWAAGYGGWSQLSIMQWGVKPLPGTGNCSLSAIRDHGVWTALVGGVQQMQPEDPGDLEQYAGVVIPDPWKDPRQTDWPQNSRRQPEPHMDGCRDPMCDLDHPHDGPALLRDEEI